jgi:hypothetical protein
LNSSLEAAALDAGFDAGEWSGPEHERALRATVLALLADAGLDPDEFFDLVAERTSPTWAHFHFGWVRAIDFDLDLR